MGKERTIQSEDQLTRIQQGNTRELNVLYKKYREKFLKWAQFRYSCPEDDAAEVYQKAFIVFYYNIKNGKVTELTSSLETYFFGIGKNVFREKFKDKYTQKTTEIDERFELKEMDMSISERYNKAHQKQVVGGLLNQIGNTCKSVLTLYYFKRYSMESIAEELGYKNDLVAKKKKYQCLKNLRKLVGNDKSLIEKLING